MNQDLALTVPTVLDPTKAFVSYSRGDADFVQQLCKDLRSAGASIWLDTLDIQPGETWDQEVERALRECGRMIVVLSPRSVTSQNVLDEVGYALSRKRPVIPALYRDCEIPFRLDRIQYADFRFDYDKGLQETLQVLGAPTVPHRRSIRGASGSSRRLPLLLPPVSASWSGRCGRNSNHQRRTATRIAAC